MSACTCAVLHHLRQIVVTGGPGAGKTAALEVLQRQTCHHVQVLPEAASILWRGGFPRSQTPTGRRAVQRAIARLQIELQRLAIENDNPALIVCDRGTLDSLAYWPGTEQEYLDDLDTTKDKELGRYAAVIHMRSPSRRDGYVQTSLRPESADEARAIDERILAVWADHPRRFVIDSDEDFVRKLERVLALVRAEIPACCR
jgi:predicted ATPase